MELELKKLFESTKMAFGKSDIKKYAEMNGHQWYYSISSTKLEKNQTVLIGYNGGAEIGVNYDPQLEIPPENFKDLYDKKWLGSFVRVYTNLKTYLKNDDVDNFVQTNFCFFRSKSEGLISYHDIELCKPLFEELIEIIKPKRIIGFSKKLSDYLIPKIPGDYLESINIPSNKKTLHVIKGKINIAGSLIPIFFLPHPNAKFTGDSLVKAWDFCFK
jgi:hypothetical protein